MHLLVSLMTRIHIIPTYHAVVIGAGIAGMSSALNLSTIFDRVTIVERDAERRFGQRSLLRKGAPQVAAVHHMLDAGRREFSKIVPDLRDRLLSMGAVELDYTFDITFQTGKEKFPKVRGGPSVLSHTRKLLERMLLLRIREVANIEVVWGGIVSDQSTDSTGLIDAVGVTFAGRSGVSISADVFVDCSGAYSKSLFQEKEVTGAEESVEVEVNYASALLSADAGRPAKGFLFTASPPDSSFVVAMPVENDGYLVTAGGRFGENRIGSEAELVNYTVSKAPRSLRSAIECAHVKQFCAPFVQRYCHWKHFDSARNSHPNLFRVGDSIASTTASAAQGMSVAVAQSNALLRSLSDSKGSSKHHIRLDSQGAYHQACERIVRPCWDRSLAGDSFYPETNAKTSQAIEDKATKLRQVLRDALTDERAFVELNRRKHNLMEI